MSDELLEKLGDEFIFHGMRVLFGITFLQYVTQPDQYLKSVRLSV